MSTFLKLHHGFLEHEKHADLSNAALMLHISGLMYASERLTDGRLPKAPMVRLAWSARLVAEGHDVDALAGELVTAGVWTDWPDRYEIVNYADHNRTKTEVNAKRAAARERQSKYRASKNPPDTDTDTDTDVMRESHRESRRDNPQEIPRAEQVTHLRAIRNGTT